ncbi:hypothetical protein FGB62_33g019 [Gracilaria domingensis]|nr:hypothetical protein FGB62_33g019 [Gracilaria domingensis]
MQSHEGGGSGTQGAKGSPPLNHNVHRKDATGPQHSIGQYPNGTGPHHSSAEHFGYSMVVNDSGNTSTKTTPRCFRHPPVYPNSYADGQPTHMTNGLKRRPLLSVSELDHRSRQPLQVIPLERSENLRAYAQPRPHKRIRINWTDEENSLFFDTIRKNSDKDEQTVLREIVSALGGSRNWIQCKGHFRNLFAVGRITREKDASKSWMVHEDVNGKEQDKAKEPTGTSKTKNERMKATPSASLNASTETTNGTMKVSSPPTLNGHLHKDNANAGNNCVKKGNGEARRSASIDRIMNPTSQDEKERDAPNIRKAENGEHRQPEYHMVRGNDTGAAKQAFKGSQSRRDGERHGFDVSRDRETAIFMIRQAAAKEAYERSNCEPTRTDDLRKV